MWLRAWCVLSVFSCPPNCAVLHCGCTAGGFGVTAALFYFAFLPDELATALDKMQQMHPPRAWAAVTAASAAAAYGTGLTTCGASGLVYVVQLGLFARAAVLRMEVEAAAASSRLPPPLPPTKVIADKTGGGSFSLAKWLGCLCTVYYAFGTAILGSWDMGIDHPYSNLRLHSGPSNHLFLPTGLLHTISTFAEDDTASLPWSGGAVLVLNSTAEYFVAQGGVPGEVSDLDDRAIAMLQRAGHTGRQFFSVAKRFSPWSSRNSNATVLQGAGFVPFTVPAFELRRLLSEGTLGANAELTYAHASSGGLGLLPPSEKRSIVTITSDSDGQIGSCVSTSGAAAPSACADNELALLPPLSEWMMMLSPVYNAYPLIDDDVSENPSGRQQLTCYG